MWRDFFDALDQVARVRPRVIDWRAVRPRAACRRCRSARNASGRLSTSSALQLEAAYHTALVAGSSESDAFDRAAAEVPDWETLAATLTQIERGAPGAMGATPASGATGADTMNVRG